MNNAYFTKSLAHVFAGLRKGDLLSEALETTGLFSGLMVQLVSTGEKSGRVDALLRKAAEFYERGIRNVVDAFSSIIEPILIIVLGSVVGSVRLALYMPHFHGGKIHQVIFKTLSQNSNLII